MFNCITYGNALIIRCISIDRKREPSSVFAFSQKVQVTENDTHTPGDQYEQDVSIQCSSMMITHFVFLCFVLLAFVVANDFLKLERKLCGACMRMNMH